MVAGVRLNLECVSELVLDRKVGLYRSVSLVSTDYPVVHAQATRSPIIEVVRTLPKTDFCDIVDHFVGQVSC